MKKTTIKPKGQYNFRPGKSLDEWLCRFAAGNGFESVQEAIRGILRDRKRADEAKKS